MSFLSFINVSSGLDLAYRLLSSVYVTLLEQRIISAKVDPLCAHLNSLCGFFQ